MDELGQPATPTSFGILLQKFRNAKRLTQTELAEKANLSRNGIADLERGARMYPRPATVLQLADALGLTAPQRAHLQAMARRPPKGNLPREVGHLPPALTPSDSLVLVGRDDQLATLGEFLRGPNGGLAAISGAPGIGKTRLLAELARRAQAEGWGVEYGRCHRWSHLEVFSPFPGILDPLDFATPEGKAAFPALDRFLLGQAQPDQEHWSQGQLDRERFLLFSEFGRYLGTRVGSAGVLLLLDDLQWIGGDALHLLQTLFQSIPPYRLLVVVSYRSTDVDDSHPLKVFLGDREREARCLRVPVEALEPSVALRLLQQAAGNPGLKTPGAWDSIVDRSMGNPYFLVQFGYHLGLEGRDSVPKAVEECLVQQLQQLSPVAKAVVGLLAVASLPVGLADLVRACELLGLPVAEVSTAVSELERRLLVRELVPGGFGMFHDLVRDVVVETSGAAPRQLSHLILARVWQATLHATRPEVLAWHFSEGHDLNTAFGYYSQAGARAEKVFSYQDAEAYYRKGLSLGLGQPVERGAMASHLARVLINRGRSDEATEIVEGALAELRSAGVLEGQAVLVSDWMACALRRGQIREGIERALEFVPIAKRLPPSHDLVHFLGFLAFFHYMEKNIGAQLEAVAWAESLMPLLSETRAQMEVMDAKSIALTSQSRYRESADLVLSQLLPLTRATGDRYKQMVVTLNLAMSLNMLGDYRQVADLLDQSQPLLQAFTGRRPLGFSLFLTLNLRYETGLWDFSLPALRAFFEKAAEEDGDYGPELRLEVGRLKRLRGDADGAAKDFATALTKPVVNSTYSLLPTILEAEIDLFRCRPDLAVASLSLLDDDPWKDYPSMYDWAAMRGCALVWAGVAGGDAMLAASVAGARSDGLQPSLADCLRWSGWSKLVRDDLEGAQRDLAEARDLDAKMGRLYALAKDLVLLALVGGPSQEGLLAQAETLLTTLEERIVAPRLQAFLTAQGRHWRDFFQR